MPEPSFPNLSSINPNDSQAILDALARIQKELQWLLTNLDDLNVNRLKADVIQGGTLRLGGPDNGNGEAVVYDAYGVERARIDNAGVTVTDSHFLLRESRSGVTQSIISVTNLVNDHSFEMIPRQGSADSHQTFEVNETYMGSEFWWRAIPGPNSVKPRVLSTYDTDLPQLALFDYQAAVVRHHSRYAWRQYVPVDPASGLPGPYTGSAFFSAFTATTANTTAYMEMWAVDATLSRLELLGTASVAINASEKWKWKRAVKTFSNLPAGTSYVELFIYCNPDVPILVDGVQFVAAPYPVVYDPESALWRHARNMAGYTNLENIYVPPSVRLQRIYGQSIATSTVTPIVWEGRVGGYNSGGMWVPSQSDRSRIYIPESGKYMIVANIRWASNPNGFRMASIYKSDGSPIAKTQVPAAYSGSSATTSLQVSTIYHFGAGDWFQIMVWQNSGGALDISPEGEATHVVAMKIGA